MNKPLQYNIVLIGMAICFLARLILPIEMSSFSSLAFNILNLASLYFIFQYSVFARTEPYRKFYLVYIVLFFICFLLNRVQFADLKYLHFVIGITSIAFFTTYLVFFIRKKEYTIFRILKVVWLFIYLFNYNIVNLDFLNLNGDQIFYINVLDDLVGILLFAFFYIDIKKVKHTVSENLFDFEKKE